MAFTASPLTEKMEATSFVYPHTVASWTLSNSYIVLSAIRHLLVSLKLYLYEYYSKVATDYNQYCVGGQLCPVIR